MKGKTETTSTCQHVLPRTAISKSCTFTFPASFFHLEIPRCILGEDMMYLTFRSNGFRQIVQKVRQFVQKI